MRDYNIIDEDLFEKVDDVVTDGFNNVITDEKEVKKVIKARKIYKAIKILLYAIMGPGFMRAAYTTSNEKDKNTNYLNRF